MRRGIRLVSATHDRIGAYLLENGGDPASVRVHLHGGPGIVRGAAVLRLDADEAHIAGAEALPHAATGMIAAAGRDHEECAVAPETKLRQRPRQIRPSIGDDA